MRREAGGGLILALVLAGCAGEASAPPPEPSASSEEIDRLIRQLGDERFQVREATSRRLLDLGEAAISALEKAKRMDDPEVASSARAILRTIRSIPAQLTRMARRGVREDLLGEKWFAGYSDGEVAGGTYFQLSADDSGKGYFFRKVDFYDGRRAVTEGRLALDFSLRECRFFPGPRKPFRAPADRKRKPLCLQFLVWFFPFQDLSVEAEEVEVSFILPEPITEPAPGDVPEEFGPASTHVERIPVHAVPSPSGEKKGESLRFEVSACPTEVWWDDQRRPIRIRLHSEFYPATREEAILAVEKGKKGEWWK